MKSMICLSLVSRVQSSGIVGLRFKSLKANASGRFEGALVRLTGEALLKL